MSRAPYADVIGDPVEHSRSPQIHRFWLEKLGLPGDFGATRVKEDEIEAYFQDRRGDPFWRGCSVTFPLKRAIASYVSDPVSVCSALGAVNCVVRSPLGCLIGVNTDIDGIGAAFSAIDLQGKRVAMLGAGGAARAAFCYLSRQHLASVAVIARRPEQAQALGEMLEDDGGVQFEAHGFDAIEGALQGSDILINATPMGMTGQGELPDELLRRISARLPAVVMDMVYAPAETRLLQAARAGGARTIDGLQMLIGQAAPAFTLFFGGLAPREHDEELRALLTR
jgi:shikimate dehydrogenase